MFVNQPENRNLQNNSQEKETGREKDEIEIFGKTQS